MNGDVFLLLSFLEEFVLNENCLLLKCLAGLTRAVTWAVTWSFLCGEDIDYGFHFYNRYRTLQVIYLFLRAFWRIGPCYLNC